MREIKIKVCGLKNASNTLEVARLKPHYMGFILYEGSPRYVSPETATRLIKNIPLSIQKVGVLVNQPLEKALDIARNGIFDLLQLHGTESADYCRRLSNHIGIIKAFSINQTLPLNLSDYQPFCKLFLFDTAGNTYGGHGKKFDHEILSDYSLETGFILGGGISVKDPAHIKSLKSDKLIAVDLNSRFEIEPGIKDVKLLKMFMDKLQ